MESSAELLKPKAVIGIDQSYSGFGLVVLHGITWGYNKWDFTKNKGGDAERLHIILQNLEHRFRELEREYDCVIAMEGYSHGSKFNREKLGELGGVVKLAVHSVFKLEPMVVPPTVLKKYVTGKGNASKQDMVDGVEDRWGCGIINHNLADAYGLAQYAKENS